MNRILLIGKIRRIDGDTVYITERTKSGSQEYMAHLGTERMINYVRDNFSFGDDIAIVGNLIEKYIEVKEVCRY